MNGHDSIKDLLPFYTAGQLDEDQRRRAAAHLETCTECQADLALWQAVSAEIVAADRSLAAPSGLLDRALSQVQRQPRRFGLLTRAWLLLRSQTPLVRREIWPASAAVIAIGCMVALIAHNSVILRILAPMLAAACISILYGPENDPAFELAAATPTSPRQILLARLALVFGYNFGLALAASLVLVPLLNTGSLLELVLAWLGPMALLSSAALLLSMVVSAGSAVTIAYLAWLIQLLPLRLVAGPSLPEFHSLGLALEWYQGLWQQPGILLLLAGLLLIPTLWFSGRRGSASMNFFPTWRGKNL